MRRPEWFQAVSGWSDWVGFSGGLLVIVGLIALFLSPGLRSDGVAFFSLPDCLDPTGACKWSAYRVRNDTLSPVVLRECFHHCELTDERGDPIVVASGAVTRDDVFQVSALVAELDWWEVRSQSRRRLGCLVLDGHTHKYDGDIVLVSSAGLCWPGAPATGVQRGRASGVAG